jgi:hypothetical protein
VRSRDAYEDFKFWAVGEGYSPNALPNINNFVQRVRAAGASKGITYKRRVGSAASSGCGSGHWVGRPLTQMWTRHERTALGRQSRFPSNIKGWTHGTHLAPILSIYLRSTTCF